MSGGQDRRGRRSDALTDRQLQARSQREIPLGDKIHQVTQDPREWVARMPKTCKRPKPPSI